ncbi:ROK family protein [Odoribacter sp. Z80]|uniref:ROK family protein n=1 Tax=Odoribacter sp. Z80 TaxID=2304575 RepID=UPI00137A9CA2|nr:ROK family protein [Odoribacter sp. Z80]NCE72449.1 ROK family protein [Odoribacter sp. Z80]
MKKQVALGIDIGGTNTAFGFIDKEGNYMAEGNISTNNHEDINDYLKELHMEIEKVLDTIRNEVELTGIGIGAPCGNYLQGTIEHASNLRWPGVIPFCDLMKEFYPHLPVYLTNDANAATIGEMIYGGAKGMKNFVMVTLGTGVGSGFVSNGELIYGHDGFAGELGHIIVSPNGRQCGCGRNGCLETYVSATGVKRTAYKMMAKYNYPSELRAIPFNEMTSKTICEAALKGDMIAINTFKYTAKMLGEALANVVAITSPEAIFLMGGLTKAGDLLFGPTKEHMEMNMLKMFSNKVKLLPSQLTKNVAIYGAAALVWKELEK